MSSVVAGQDDLPAGEWEVEELEYQTPIYPASVIGTDDADTIEIHYDGDGEYLAGTVNGLKAFRFSFDYCNGDYLESLMEPRVIRVFAGAGADRITVNMPYSQCPCEILGGPGDDRVEVDGCMGGNVHGNSGDDKIEVKEHNIELRVYGGSGDDKVVIKDGTSTWADEPAVSQAALHVVNVTQER